MRMPLLTAMVLGLAASSARADDDGFEKLFNGKDKAFFFVNYEEFRIPEHATRQRTILSEPARSGVFRYGTNGSVNLYTLAAANGHTSTPDPTIAKLLQDIRNSTTQTGAVQALTDPNLERFTFTNTGNQSRYFPRFVWIST